MVTDYLEKFSIGMPTNVNWWDLPNRIVDSQIFQDDEALKTAKSWDFVTVILHIITGACFHLMEESVLYISILCNQTLHSMATFHLKAHQHNTKSIILNFNKANLTYLTMSATRSLSSSKTFVDKTCSCAAGKGWLYITYITSYQHSTRGEQKQKSMTNKIAILVGEKCHFQLKKTKSPVGCQTDISHLHTYN